MNRYTLDSWQVKSIVTRVYSLHFRRSRTRTKNGCEWWQERETVSHHSPFELAYTIQRMCTHHQKPSENRKATKKPIFIHVVGEPMRCLAIGRPRLAHTNRPFTFHIRWPKQKRDENNTSPFNKSHIETVYIVSNRSLPASQPKHNDDLNELAENDNVEWKTNEERNKNSKDTHTHTHGKWTLHICYCAAI